MTQKNGGRMTSFKEIPFTAQTRLVWAFLWRGMLITVGSAMGGAIAGGIIGFVLALIGSLLGLPPDTTRLCVRILGGLAGVAVGVVFVWIYIYWLFAAKPGGYTLRLVPAQESPA
jgi:ABC-type amino acid transport system permease subunit